MFLSQFSGYAILRSTFICLIGVAFSVFLSGCTNFSGSKANTAPPILVSVTAQAANVYRIEARAQNPEILFQGYRLYPGLTDKDSRNPGDLNQGIDCFGGTSQFPNLPLVYIYEITPEAGAPSSGVICRFVADLGPGTFVTIRSLLLGLSVNNGGISLEPSGPSNTLILPTFTDPNP